MRVCNPCGSAGTWRVRLAGVQRAVHEGLWWLLHLCLRHERRTQSQEGEVDAEKWGKYLWRKSKCLRDNGGRRGGAVIFADSNEKGVHRRERKKNWREQTGCVFVMDYFCGVACVCSSCGQWIMLEFMRMSICWSHSAFFFVSVRRHGFQTFIFQKGGTVWRQHSHQPGDTLHHLTDLQRCSESAWAQRKDRYTAATVSRLGLGSNQLVTPFCSLL